MLSLKPSSHALSDNGWHFTLLTVLCSVFVWLGWEDLLVLYRSGNSLTGMELALSQGKGHALYVWVETLTDSQSPWIWNRVISGMGWFCTLILLSRIVSRLTGFLSSIPAIILLITFPGLSMYMSSAGSGSWGLFVFLLSFSAVLLEDHGKAWLKGGMYASIAVVLNPVLFLPSIGLIAGLAENNRVRLLKVLIGYAASMAVAIILFMVLTPGGISTLLPGPAQESTYPPDVIQVLLTRHVFLVAALILMLVCGARRRGMSWWCLMACLPLPVLEPMLFSGPMAVCVPVILLFALAFSKLPSLMQIRFPRSYLSVFICQLILWIPVYLADQEPVIFNAKVPAADATSVTTE